jgi:hypothetical protein
MGHIVVETRTANAVPLLRFSCSKRVIALPAGHMNARRVSHDSVLFSFSFSSFVFYVSVCSLHSDAAAALQLQQALHCAACWSHECTQGDRSQGWDFGFLASVVAFTYSSQSQAVLSTKAAAADATAAAVGVHAQAPLHPLGQQQLLAVLVQDLLPYVTGSTHPYMRVNQEPTKDSHQQPTGAEGFLDMLTLHHLMTHRAVLLQLARILE